VIRSRAELIAKSWAALELAMALLLVWGGSVVGPVVVGQPLLGRVVGIILGFLLGVILPALVFGLPTLELKWNIDERDVSGKAFVDLRLRAVPAVPFTVVLHGKHQSLLGWVLLHRAKSKGMYVSVEFRPVGAARLTARQWNAGSSLHNPTTEPEVRLDVIDDDHDSDQTMFVGNILPGSVPGTGDNISVRAELRRPVAHTKVWWGLVVSSMQSLTVRK
jgi:hypothetical protein